MTVKNITIAAVIAELCLFVILAVALQPQWQWADPATRPPQFAGSFQNFTVIEPRRPAPQIKMLDGDGQELGLDAFRGKVVLLNFWATWCAPCRREMPALDRLQATLGGPDFQVVTLSVDRLGKAVVAPWLKRLGLTNLGVYLDPKSVALRAFGVTGLPASYMIDRAGRVAGVILGPAEWDSDEAKALIDFYLAEPRPG